jgi:predicted enzyme related to lactoylglutathione lyase
MPSNPWVWYEYMGEDADAADRFYGDVVGWTTTPFPGGLVPYLIIEAEGCGMGGMMSLTDEMKAAGAKPRWMGHVAVADVDAKAAEIAAAGGSIHKAPTDIPEVGRFAVVADRQGASFSIFQPKQDGEMPKADPMAPGRIQWHELGTSDWQDALAFYSAMFGWTQDHAMDMGEMGTYLIYAIDGAPAGGMMNVPMPPAWLFYARVPDDIDAAAGRITAGGGSIVHGPVEVPGGDWVVIAIDPQGAGFGVVGAKKQA